MLQEESADKDAELEKVRNDRSIEKKQQQEVSAQNYMCKLLVWIAKICSIKQWMDYHERGVG